MVKKSHGDEGKIVYVVDCYQPFVGILKRFVNVLVEVEVVKVD